LPSCSKLDWQFGKSTKHVAAPPAIRSRKPGRAGTLHKRAKKRLQHRQSELGTEAVVPGKTERKVSQAAAFNLQSACVRDKPFVSIGGPECDANTLASSYDHASEIMVAVRHPGDNLAEPLLALSAVRIGKRCSASAQQLLPKSSSKRKSSARIDVIDVEVPGSGYP
jgi:hypothetical protein